VFRFAFDALRFEHISFEQSSGAFISVFIISVFGSVFISLSDIRYLRLMFLPNRMLLLSET
jgi:hypothetical protein